MSTQIITHSNMGYSWNYSLEVERVVPVEGTRASAKTTDKFTVGGNSQTYADALKEMNGAIMDVAKMSLKLDIEKIVEAQK